MINLPMNAFLVGANRKLGNVAECLLLSEIYMRGRETSSFVMSRDYVEKVLGIKRTSQNNYYSKFEELKLCKVETNAGRRIITPNMKAITKFIEEGSDELVAELDVSNITYEVRGGEDKKKKPQKAAKQTALLKQSFRSRIDYEYMIDSAVTKEYKNLRARGTTFKGKDGVNYSLTKLDDAIGTGDFSKLTATDFTEYLIIIYEAYYKTTYPRSVRDVANMNKFLKMNLMKRSDILDWFICFIERYEPLGFATEEYPRFNAWALTIEWVVRSLMDNKKKTGKSKGRPKNDGVVRWDDKVDTTDTELYEESEEVF